MSRSIALRFNCIERAKLAVKRNGFLSQRNLAESAGFSLATVGKFLRGKPVDVATFVELCTCLSLDWQEVANLESSLQGAAAERPLEPTPEPDRSEPVAPAVASVSAPRQQPDWGDAPHPSHFFGRERELARLQAWIETDRVPVILFLGMGGIGKTTLAAKLARRVQHDFDCTIWRSLRSAPSLEVLLGSLLPYLSDRTQVPETLDERLLLLARCLRSRRCLVVLDNVESILQAGSCGGGYRPSYESYSQLFGLLSGLDGHSCLLLTSREKPPEIVTRADSHCLSLTGLDPAAGWELLQAQTRFVGATPEGGRCLVERYGGNPLALKLIAATIQDFVAGNVADFLQVLSEGPVLLDDIRQLLAEQFERLGSREREISYWLAIACEPISWRDLQTYSVSRFSAGELLSALSDLDRRSLLEKHGETFTQPAAIQEYLLAELATRICQEILDCQPHWLGRYALMQAQTREYARTAQQQLILHPVAERLLAELGDERIVASYLQAILAAARDREPGVATNSYVASNVIHIARHLGLSLQGWDFSELPVRQAYLQGLDLQDTNFQNCQFQHALFTQPFGSIRAIAFAPPGTSLGQALATGDTTGEVRLWGLQEQQTIFSHRNHSNWVCALAFSPDGRLLASGCADGKLSLWRAETNETALVLAAHDRWIMSLAFSPDGRLLATASGDRTLKLWEVASGQCRQTLPGHGGGVWSVAFSPHGKLIASGGADNTIKLWSASDGCCLQVLAEHENWVWDVAFGPQGNLLASGSADGTVKLWEVAGGRCQRTLQGHGNWVWCVAFSPYCDSIASGSEDRTLRLWETDSGRCWLALAGQGNWVWSVAFSPDGKTLASGSADRCLRLWPVEAETSDPPAPQLLGKAAGAIWSVAYSPDGKDIASGNEDGSIRLWSRLAETTVAPAPPRLLVGHAHAVWSVAFSPDSQTIASGSADRALRLWDARSGQCLQVLRGHKHWVMGVAFSADGRQVASASGDRTLKLWDVASGNCLQTLTGHASGLLAVAWGNGLLATAGTDRAIRLWDAASGTCLRALLGHQNWVVSVAFSPDGRWLASGGADRAICLWDVETGECRRLLQGHGGSVWSVAFQPRSDGHLLLASGSDDKTIKFWDALTGRCCRTLATREPYAGMNAVGVRGLTAAQRLTLASLGAMAD